MEGLYYFYHSEAAPLKLNRDPRDFHNMEHKEIMKVICKSDTDMKMEWTKCTFFLIDQAKENGIVLITKENDVDPSLDWLSNNVIGAYDLMKQAGLYVTPIISALENPKLPPDIPQLWQVLGLEKEGTKFPRLFVTNGREGTAVEYPSSLDDDLDFAPELIVLWARRTLLYQEIKYMKERLAALNESVDETSTDIAEQAVQYLNALKKELKIVKKKHDEIAELVQKNKYEYNEAMKTKELANE